MQYYKDASPFFAGFTGKLLQQHKKTQGKRTGSRDQNKVYLEGGGINAGAKAPYLYTPESNNAGEEYLAVFAPYALTLSLTHVHTLTQGEERMMP